MGSQCEPDTNFPAGRREGAVNEGGHKDSWEANRMQNVAFQSQKLVLAEVKGWFPVMVWGFLSI